MGHRFPVFLHARRVAAGRIVRHTGFTGTSLWIDPTTDTFIVLLTNAVQLKEGTVIALRTEVATAVAEVAVESQPGAEAAPVAHHWL